MSKVKIKISVLCLSVAFSLIGCNSGDSVSQVNQVTPTESHTNPDENSPQIPGGESDNQALPNNNESSSVINPDGSSDSQSPDHGDTNNDDKSGIVSPEVESCVNPTSSWSTSFDLPTPPSPQMTTGCYKGVKLDLLSQPKDSQIGILTKQYPDSYLPNYTQGKSLNISYGFNDEVAVAKISALVIMDDSSLCTATPIKYDKSSNTTYLVGAAHCFLKEKSQANTVVSSDLYTNSQLSVFYTPSYWVGRTQYSVKNVYIPNDYCQGATFAQGSTCPNFTPNYGVNGGKGNDIAVIAITSEFGGAGNSVNYPHVVSESEHPQGYTNAPILSIGYGLSSNQPATNLSCSVSNCANLNYVSGYYYLKKDAPGYHYLYHSYYNDNYAFNQTGYTALICSGDSGGGDLFWTGDKWILLSNHTYGPANSCGMFYNYLPNGATNVSAYYDWINGIVNLSS